MTFEAKLEALRAETREDEFFSDGIIHTAMLAHRLLTERNALRAELETEQTKVRQWETWAAFAQKQLDAKFEKSFNMHELQLFVNRHLEDRELAVDLFLASTPYTWVRRLDRFVRELRLRKEEAENQGASAREKSRMSHYWFEQMQELWRRGR